ncbi:MAG: polysaccharide biosynthesis/export family protein [Brevundimonas sp.]
MKSSLIALSAALALAGCASLPADGPSARSIGGDDVASAGYALVDLGYDTAERVRQAQRARPGGLSGLAAASAVGAIGPGDLLEISIYDPSGVLFGSRSSLGVSSAGAQALPTQAVDEDGEVIVPFAGAVRVAGLQPAAAAAAIQRALRGRVANPQVVVSVAESVASSVIVLGEVQRPGRAALRPNANRLLDVIALAGGGEGRPEDLEVVVSRGGRQAAAPLTLVSSDPAQNVILGPGDQVLLRSAPRRFSSFGALGRVANVEMPSGTVSLTEALSLSGGLQTERADAASVLVFRLEDPAVAQAIGLTQPATPRGVPVVYRLNLREPAGFFTATAFEVRPDDVIYAPSASTAELRKFFEFVQSITRVVYDIQVAGTLNND